MIFFPVNRLNGNGARRAAIALQKPFPGLRRILQVIHEHLTQLLERIPIGLKRGRIGLQNIFISATNDKETVFRIAQKKVVSFHPLFHTDMIGDTTACSSSVFDHNCDTPCIRPRGFAGIFS